MSENIDKTSRGKQGNSTTEIKRSIERIEGDLYHGTESIWVRLGKVEEKLNHVATKSFILTMVLTGVVVFSAIVFAILWYLEMVS
ncbi:MAG: hypothetical protein OXI19_12025 [Gemmatimonadota bacterium]|nr:hypothetical protein [Gemmatimonadota bacterium]MYB60505.1 hypothetical protein [Gemmatimonadota bacterium]